MNRIIFLFVCILAFLTGCAGTSNLANTATRAPGNTSPTSGLGTKPVSMPAITYIVPIDDGLVGDFSRGLSGFKFESPDYLVNDPKFYVDRVLAKEAPDNQLLIDRNTSIIGSVYTKGSGIRYLINYTIEKGNSEYKFVFQPIKVTSYQQGLLFPVPIPKFDNDDLLRFLMGTRIEYKFEVDSEFNKESIYANFERTAKITRPKKENIPATGRISCKGKPVSFSLEIFPYRNGSKAVLSIQIPGMASSNTVDFRTMLDEAKAQLVKIVKS